MQITLTRSAGSYGVGSVLNVPDAVAHLLVQRGWATVEEEGGTSPGGSPEPGQQAQTQESPEEPNGEAPTEAPPEIPTPQAMSMSASTGDAPAAVATTSYAPQDDLRGMLKADLVTTAQGEGIRLDGSETKADLITRIERHRRRYGRRDMQARK